jgi:hypothetical protein
MTQEEKLALIKASGINVNGDLVLEKHVDYEIGNVETGGIGVQIINGGKTAVKSVSQSGKPSTKNEAPRLVSDCFTYRWLNDYPQKIAKLYQALLKGKLIAEDTKPDAFHSIFAGRNCDAKVKWIGKQAGLWYLFKLLFERNYVSWPQGVGQWIIVQSHFVDDKSHIFTDFNSQHEPKKMSGAIDAMAELLNPSADIET